MITKLQIKINYIEEISTKFDAKEIKYDEISKKLIEGFGQFFGYEHKKRN